MGQLIIGSSGETEVQAATEEILTKKYVDQVGHKATIQRETLINERTEGLKEVLQEIGQNASDVGIVPKGMEYVGSVAVHIYQAPNLGTVAHFNQVALNNCPEPLAGPAVSDLRGTMLEYYGRRRQKKRSGF